VWNADRVLRPLGQFFCFLGTLPWWPASAGLLRFLPKGISLSTFESSLFVPPSSAAVYLVVAAASSEIANAAAETVVRTDVNSITVAELLLVFLPKAPVPLPWILELPKLCLLGRGKLVILGCGAVLVRNVGHIIDLFLRNKLLCMGIGSTLSATTVSPMALSTTP
jgi:hypothetical protein